MNSLPWSSKIPFLEMKTAWICELPYGWQVPGEPHKTQLTLQKTFLVSACWEFGSASHPLNLIEQLYGKHIDTVIQHEEELKFRSLSSTISNLQIKGTYRTLIPSNRDFFPSYSADVYWASILVYVLRYSSACKSQNPCVYGVPILVREENKWYKRKKSDERVGYFGVLYEIGYSEKAFLIRPWIETWVK